MHKRTINYYALVSISFIADLVLLALCHAPVLFLTRAVYYAQAAVRIAPLRLFVPAGLLVLESFLYGGCCGIDFIVMIPLTLVLFKLKKIVTGSLWVYSLLAFGCFTIHTLVIDYGLFGRSFDCVVNLRNSLIHGILIVIVIRYILRGSQGNRL